ncbi:phage tail protein [Bifidobacterium callitrichidarum]|uniref:Phage tail protein n=2 Tax=Bifidobacterium callitrichidarum TaxID=2052941 RepID=A0A2U2N7D2_9BIFI|nr:phage tail protein [Bifidobacterium callitrichidarum]
MSVRITGNADDAVRAFEKTTSKAAAFGSFMGGAALKGVTALWDTIKGFSSAVMDMSDSTDKFKNTMSFAGLDTAAVDKATAAARKYADDTVYDLSTIQNTTAQLAANGITNYTELTEAAGNLNAVAGGNSDTFKSVAMMLTQTAGAGKLTTENWNQLADAIPGASGKLQEALAANGAYTGNFRDAMADGEITADEFNQALLQLGMSDVAKEAATSTQTMEGALGNLEAAITGGLTDAFNLVKPLVTGAIGKAAETVSDFAGKATGAMKDFIGGIQDTGAFQAASDMVGALGGAFQSLGGALGDIATTLLPGLQGLGDAGSIGQGVGDAFAGAAGVVKTVADALSSFGDWVSANAEPIASALVGFGTGFAVFKVAGIIQAVAGALQGFSLATTAASVAQWALNAAMNANPIVLIITAIAALVAGLIYFFTQTETGKQIWANFTEFISTAVNNIIAFFQGLGDSIGQAFSNAARFAQDKWNSVVAWFKSIPGMIGGFFSNAGSILYNAGKNILDGFLNGLKSAWNNVTDFVGGIADWIAEHKGPASYDRVLLVRNGRLIMQGLAKGMTTGFDRDVRSAVARINTGLASTVLTAPAVTATGGDTGGGGDTVNVSVTFTGLVTDPDGVARQIRRVLNDYDRKRG